MKTHPHRPGTVAFVVVAVTVGSLVGVAARRRMESERARTEATVLARLAGWLVRSDDPLPEIVHEMRTVFGLTFVAVQQRSGARWVNEVVSGEPAGAEASAAFDLGRTGRLLLGGRRLSAEDRSIIQAFANQLAAAVRARRMRKEAAKASELTRVSELRGAILAAVSHDLRTPLASIKAAASSLRQRDVTWTEEQRDEFLTTIEEETDRLTALVGNLLDMSRLQAGAIEAVFGPVGVDEVVLRALSTLRGGTDVVDVDVPEGLPRVKADASLFERALANLIGNAMMWSPLGRPVRVDASCHQDRVVVRIVDRGPGIKEEDRMKVFEPFQRVVDGGNGAGLGLGLAVARGFIETMGGRLVLSDTPGGGLTTMVSLERSG